MPTGLSASEDCSHCRRLQQVDGRWRLLTLFTTFRHSANRRAIHRNTIDNWSTLRLFGVTPLLYVVDPERRGSSSENTIGWTAVKDHARRSGWIVRPYDDVSTRPSRSVSQAPVLRRMFIDAERTSRCARGRHRHAMNWFTVGFNLFCPEFQNGDSDN